MQNDRDSTRTEEILIYKSEDGKIQLDVHFDDETVWLSQEQMAKLFQKDRTVIGRHIKNVFHEGELDEKVVCANFTHTTAHGAMKGRTQVAIRKLYNLDVIISVGYRVKSIQGVLFRKWASSVLKEYLLKGYALNRKRLQSLGQVVRLMKRAEKSLDAPQVLSVVERYGRALDLLDSYDHQTVSRPRGRCPVHVLTYEECRKAIDQMRFGRESSLFGVEKDDAFRGCIGNVYQSFDGVEIYPSLQEKAANLLYLITKNHCFVDGNKRIAATIFLYFLDRNGALFKDGEKTIDDHTLVALTIMIAESRPEEKEMMIDIIVNCLGQ